MLVNWLPEKQNKTKLWFVAFADFCGVNTHTRCQANNSWTVSSHSTAFCPLTSICWALVGVRHAVMCWLFLLYFSLSTSHPPPAHSSPQVGFNSGYFLASCGAQPMGATNRTSECGEERQVGSWSPSFFFYQVTQFGVAWIPLWEGLAPIRQPSAYSSFWVPRTAPSLVPWIWDAHGNLSPRAALPLVGFSKPCQYLHKWPFH